MTKFDGFQMLKIYYLFIQIIQILDITVDNEAPNTSLPNSIEFKYGRSIHYNIISTIPLITNEEQKKLDELLPTSPILIVDNLGRLNNSNPSA